MPSSRLTFTPPLPDETLKALGTEPSPLSVYLAVPSTTKFQTILRDVLSSIDYDQTPTQTVTFLLSRGCPAGGPLMEFTKPSHLSRTHEQELEAVVEFSVYPMHLKGQGGETSYIDHIYGSVDAAKEVADVKVTQERLCAVLEGALHDVLDSLRRIWDYGAKYQEKDAEGNGTGEGEGHVVVQGVIRVQRAK
ncbi:hypothetical protein BJ508DRAFT_412996 [Ascobolus immersus RN42]|uniref:Thiamin/hydroxymethyl pyrimidine-binding YkoF putative domain-containing protein n=1 Tax=Ascobolus immersus RN42 TaxID=1160509 RepID=A0A3N4IEF3_ASCIM|nr:hypothetical protein BJ508DRAFT_412996 [Ascobolus immersus RN42]